MEDPKFNLISEITKILEGYADMPSYKKESILIAIERFNYRERNSNADLCELYDKFAIWANQYKLELVCQALQNIEVTKDTDLTHEISKVIKSTMNDIGNRIYNNLGIFIDFYLQEGYKYDTLDD
jgi:hypothetical protein